MLQGIDKTHAKCREKHEITPGISLPSFEDRRMNETSVLSKHLIQAN